MLYYDTIYVSEEIDIIKASVSKQCDICHYWYFLDKGFKLEPNVYSGCHDVLMVSMYFSDISILKIYGVDYCYYHRK